LRKKWRLARKAQHHERNILIGEGKKNAMPPERTGGGELRPGEPKKSDKKPEGKEDSFGGGKGVLGKMAVKKKKRR